MLAATPTHETEADVVVVGFGLGGATAALSAARAGASVVVLEKQLAGAHFPNARMASGGVVMTANDVDRATRYLDACAGGMTPAGVNAAWAERAARLESWIGGVGVPTRRIGSGFHDALPGHDAVDVLAMPATGRDAGDVVVTTMAGGDGPAFPDYDGAEFAALLEQRAAAHERVEVRYGQRAVRLVRDASGRVDSVRTASGGGSAGVRARRGVVLAAGGFEFDAAMKRDYLKAHPIYFYGSSSNAGDGVRLAQQVGADLWHMNAMVGRAMGHFELAGRELNFLISIGPPGYVIVDQDGHRFAGEHHQAAFKAHFYYELLSYDGIRMRYPRIPSYWLFDRRRMGAGPLAAVDQGIGRAGVYRWSADNAREVEQGWISRGRTVAEAAQAAGHEDPDAVARTVEAYNAGCRTGDDPFGRPPESLVPLGDPPFYCVPLYPGGASTCGGPRRNERAEVLDTDGHRIPGLYAAGELGSVMGLVYPAPGANFSDALCFGQIAAEAALGTL